MGKGTGGGLLVFLFLFWMIAPDATESAVSHIATGIGNAIERGLNRVGDNIDDAGSGTTTDSGTPAKPAKPHASPTAVHPVG